MAKFSDEIKVLEAGGPKAFAELLRQHPGLAQEVRDGSTLLTEVVGLGHPDAATMLLEAGALPSQLNAAGFTALHQVIESCDEHDSNLDVARILVERGADIEKVGLNGWRPLHQATTYGLTKFVQLLLSHGADVNARCEAFDRENPLEIAQRLRNRELVDLLGKHGARSRLKGNI